LAGFFELIDDEAYYNFWSTSISLGYYDHPPMVAWWIYLGKFIFGSTTLGVRFFPVLSFFFVSLLVGRIAFLVSGNKNVVLSVLLFLVGLLNGIQQIKLIMLHGYIYLSFIVFYICQL